MSDLVISVSVSDSLSLFLSLFDLLALPYFISFSHQEVLPLQICSHRELVSHQASRFSVSQ